MSKLYLIGGAPRTGKTTLVLKVLAEQPMLAISTDAIRYTLRRVIPREQEPALFQILEHQPDDPQRVQQRASHPEEILAELNAESEILWPHIVDFIDSNMEDGFDLLVEGVAVLPALVSQLKHDYSAIYLGNRSVRHFETIRQSARYNPKDWMHGYQDETIESYCVFFQHFSRWIEQEATKYAQPYIEMNDLDFDASINKALTSLLK